MRIAFAGACAGYALVVLAACIQEPEFTIADGGTSVTSDDMALIPAATLGAAATLGPADDGKDKDDGGKGKGKDDKDAGTRCVPLPLLGVTCSDAGVDASTTTTTTTTTAVPSFWLDRREVTVLDYAACVAAKTCPAAGAAPGCTKEPDHPVTCVPRTAAAAYCGWKSKRLVRSLEHVAAAAATVGRTYPWGVEPPSADRLNACGPECKPKGMYAAPDRWSATAPVGSLPSGATSDGVFDLAGNVAEWVDGDPSVVRGGSYADTDVAAVRSVAAVATPPGTSAPTIGFRCARDL